MTTSGGSLRGSWDDCEGEAGVGSIFGFEALEGELGEDDEDGGGCDEEGMLDIFAVTEGMTEVTEESTFICLSPVKVLTVSVTTGLETMLNDLEKDASGRRLFDERMGSAATIASVSFGGTREGCFWSWFLLMIISAFDVSLTVSVEVAS